MQLFKTSFIHSDKRRYNPRWLLSILLAFSLSLSACAPFGSNGNAISTETETSDISAAETSRFSSYLDTLFRNEVVSNTLNMHYTVTSPENYGIKSYPVTLGTVSKENYEQELSSYENIEAVLKKYDYDSLSKEDRLTYDVMESYMDTQLTFSDYYYYDEILKPGTGFQAELPVLLAEYQFYDKQDIKDYLSLLSDIERYFDEIIEFEIQKSDAGLFMPDFEVNAIAKECSDFCQQTDEHYLITTFRQKISAMTNISDEDKEKYMAKNETLVTESVLPAYEGLSEALVSLKGTGKNEKGLCYLPKGKIYYSNLVHAYTGSSHTIEELEDMTDQKRDSDLLTISNLLKTNPNVQEEANAFSIDTSDPEAVLNYLLEQISTDFQVPSDTNFKVNYVDACLQDAMAPAFYLTAPIDDLSQNAIYINPSNNATGIKLFTTLAHEGFPGHMYQTVMSYEAGLSPFRSLLNYPGYSEGWATYVELMSYSYAGLTEDAATLLSCNQSALLSLYASCDMGIHYDGWDLSDTIKFFRNYGVTDIDTIQDIYEYIVEEPANYLKYYIGYLEFLDLRDMAKEKYGENYSNKKFHQAVVSIGPAPFNLLQKYLEEFYN